MLACATHLEKWHQTSQNSMKDVLWVCWKPVNRCLQWLQNLVVKLRKRKEDSGRQKLNLRDQDWRVGEKGNRYAHLSVMSIQNIGNWLQDQCADDAAKSSYNWTSFFSRFDSDTVIALSSHIKEAVARRTRVFGRMNVLWSDKNIFVSSTMSGQALR